MIGVLLVCVVLGIGLAAIRLGFHQRLALVLRAPSICAIPDFAARRSADRIIFELEEPLGWRLPGDDHGGDERGWSARKVRDAASRIAAALRTDLGMERNDRAAIYKADDFDVFLFSLAITRAGGISVPINGQLHTGAVEQYLAHVNATVLFCDVETLSTLIAGRVAITSVRHIVVTNGGDREPAPVLAVAAACYRVPCHSLSKLLARHVTGIAAVPKGPDDPVYLVHTSGTTGFPKAVIVLARGLASSMRAALVFNLVSRRDLCYLAVPFNHQVTHLYLNGVLAFGGRVILSRRFEPGRALSTIAARRVSAFFGFPLAYTQMAAEDLTRHDLRSMRIWATTADASHEAHQRKFIARGSFFKQLGIPLSGSIFVDGLGSSEVGIAALLRIVGPWTRRFGRRVGRPIPLLGPKVKIVDVNGQPVRRDEPGRLMVKGPSLFGGYWNAHDKLFAVSADGWWFTGDIVSRTGRGSYVHLDREVDVIHHPGGTSYTLPIEEEILKHDAIYDTTVFACTGDGPSTCIAAIVALKPGYEDIPREQLEREINARLNARDRISILSIRLWSDFPIGVTGKTLKRTLREAA